MFVAQGKTLGAVPRGEGAASGTTGHLDAVEVEPFSAVRGARVHQMLRRQCSRAGGIQRRRAVIGDGSIVGAQSHLVVGAVLAKGEVPQVEILRQGDDARRAVLAEIGGCDPGFQRKCIAGLKRVIEYGRRLLGAENGRAIERQAARLKPGRR